MKEKNIKEQRARNYENKALKHNESDISNITGGITDEEFADEYLTYPTYVNTQGTKFQLNSQGADLEKISTAKKVRNDFIKE